MRTIKFRAWDDEAKDMVSPLQIDFNRDGIKWILPRGNETKVMQFTGIKDKNGVEIYESDICSDGDYTFVVEWQEQGGWYWRQTSKNEEDESAMFTSHDIAGSLEIIGNIHQDPELLTPNT